MDDHDVVACRSFFYEKDGVGERLRAVELEGLLDGLFLRVSQVIIIGEHPHEKNI
jgi:hypothetical protein